MSFTQIFNPAYEAASRFTKWQALRMSPATKQFFVDAKDQVEVLKQDVTNFVHRDSRGKAVRALESSKAQTKTWADGIERSVKSDLTTVGGHGQAHINEVADIAKKTATENMEAGQNEAGIETAIRTAWRDWADDAPIDHTAAQNAIKARLKAEHPLHAIIDDDTFVGEIADEVKNRLIAGEDAATIRDRIHAFLGGKGVDTERDAIANSVRDELIAQKTAAKALRRGVVNDAATNLNTHIGNNFANVEASHAASDRAAADLAADSNELGPKVTLKASTPVLEGAKAGKEALQVKVETPDGGSVEAALPKRAAGQSAEDYVNEQKPRIERLIDLQDRSHATGQVGKKFFMQGRSELTDAGMDRHDEALQFFEDGTRSAELASLRTGSGVEVKAYGRSKPAGPDTLKVTIGRKRLGVDTQETHKVALPKKDTLTESLEEGKEYAEAFETEQRKRISPSLMTAKTSNPFKPAKLSDGTRARYTGIDTALNEKDTELTALQTNHRIAIKAKLSSKGAHLRVKHPSMNATNWFDAARLNKTRHLPLDSSNYKESVNRAVDYADRLTTKSHPDISPRLMREKTGKKAVKEAGIIRFDAAKEALDRTGQTQTDIAELRAHGISLRVRGNGEIQVTHKGGGMLGLSKKQNIKMTRGESWQQFVDRAITTGQGIMDASKSTSSRSVW